MLRTIALLTIVVSVSSTLFAQTDPNRPSKNYPLILTLQFHAFGVPFRHVGANFKNVGVGIGTEVTYTRDPHLVQQLTMVWYRNKAIGNGLLFYTQLGWRPYFSDSFFGEFKAGVGYLLASRPGNAYLQRDGEWIPMGHHGKGMLMVPVGIGLGMDQTTEHGTISPYANYQFMIVTRYNTSIPVVPETLIQTGVMFNPK